MPAGRNGGLAPPDARGGEGPARCRRGRAEGRVSRILRGQLPRAPGLEHPLPLTTALGSPRCGSGANWRLTLHRHFKGKRGGTWGTPGGGGLGPGRAQAPGVTGSRWARRGQQKGLRPGPEWGVRGDRRSGETDVAQSQTPGWPRGPQSGLGADSRGCSSQLCCVPTAAPLRTAPRWQRPRGHGRTGRRTATCGSPADRVSLGS